MFEWKKYSRKTSRPTYEIDKNKVEETLEYIQNKHIKTFESTDEQIKKLRENNDLSMGSQERKSLICIKI